MKLDHFSLLYPDGPSQVNADHPDVDMYTLQELGLLDVFDINNRPLCDYVTDDPAVIAYRLDTFADLLQNPSLMEMLTKLVPVLQDITELRRMEEERAEDDAEAYLTGLTKIELYISCVNVLHAGMKAVSTELKSHAFRRLCDCITELADSDYYRELNKRLSELTQRVREIRSVTIGVNLDAQLRPAQAGVLSINAQPFRSGDTLDKILRLNFKEDEFTCIANLVPFGKKQNDNQKAALSNAFHSAIRDVYHASLRSWKRVMQSYVLENTDFLLELLPEIEFLVKGAEFQQKLKERGCTLSTPVIAATKERAFRATGLYNPVVALKSEAGGMVTNDMYFDTSAENALLYVLTGPNRGGKSVITCAVGLCQIMMQLGMYVPAERAEISPVDGLYTHFPTGADDTIDKGRLGEECARFSELFDAVTAHSLVLLDESFSSTGAYEASYIAAEVLAGLSQVGCRCLFSTHLHQLAADVDTINKRTAPTGGARIDTLVAGIEGEGKRSFRIVRAKPDGKSHAQDIAERYGLTYSDILKKVNP
jgi:hypothetical protein